MSCGLSHGCENAFEAFDRCSNCPTVNSGRSQPRRNPALFCFLRLPAALLVSYAASTRASRPLWQSCDGTARRELARLTSPGRAGRGRSDFEISAKCCPLSPVSTLARAASGLSLMSFAAALTKRALRSLSNAPQRRFSSHGGLGASGLSHGGLGAKEEAPPRRDPRESRGAVEARAHQDHKIIAVASAKEAAQRQ